MKDREHERRLGEGRISVALRRRGGPGAMLTKNGSPPSREKLLTDADPESGQLAAHHRRSGAGPSY